MAQILQETVKNNRDQSWVRNHAMNHLTVAYCGSGVYADGPGITMGEGQVTCPDCVQIILDSKQMDDSDLLAQGFVGFGLPSETQEKRESPLRKERAFFMH